jgi:hypothetical protein
MNDNIKNNPYIIKMERPYIEVGTLETTDFLGCEVEIGDNVLYALDRTERQTQALEVALGTVEHIMLGKNTTVLIKSHFSALGPALRNIRNIVVMPEEMLPAAYRR